jgi:co-chaperonin GroES (HSP10)
MMRPVGAYLLVEETKEAAMMGGLIVDISEQRYRRGVVLAVGPDVPDGITEGSAVYYDGQRSLSMLLDGRSVTVLRAVDIVLCDA